MIRVTDAFINAFKDVKILYEISSVAEEIVVEPKKNLVMFLYDTKSLPDDKKFEIARKLMENMRPVKRFFEMYGLRKFNVEMGIIESGDVGNEVPSSELRRANTNINTLNRIYDTVNTQTRSLREFANKLSSVTASIGDVRNKNEFELILSMSLYVRPENEGEYDLKEEFYNLMMIAYRELYGEYIRDFSLYDALDERVVYVLKKAIESKYPVIWDEVRGRTIKDKVINYIVENNLESSFIPIIKMFIKDKGVFSNVEVPKEFRELMVTAEVSIEETGKSGVGEREQGNDNGKKREESKNTQQRKTRPLKELTEEEIEAIKRDILNGVRMKEIMEKYNISERTYRTIKSKVKGGERK